jgi:hypothetical protein
LTDALGGWLLRIGDCLLYRHCATLGPRRREALIAKSSARDGGVAVIFRAIDWFYYLAYGFELCLRRPKQSC